MEKRRQIYKNVRKDLEKGEQVQREVAYQEKMADLERKHTLKEQDKRLKDQQAAQDELERKKTASAKQQETQNFLDNIKTYNVD